MCGRATLTTVASRISISWATSTMAIPAAARPASGGRSVGRSVGSERWVVRPEVLDARGTRVWDMGDGGPVLAERADVD
jgi:hypothetical protein